MNTTDKSRPVLLTGSEGSIGRVLSPTLRAAGYRVREFDHKPDADHDPDVEGNIQADLAEPGVLDQAAEGVSAIIHLAAFPDPADFIDVLLQPNVVGLYRVLEAARKNNVPKLILASSVQAVNDAGDAPEPLTVTLRRPDNLYGLTKVWAEDAGEMYARKYGLNVLAVRVGWFLRNAGAAAQMQDMRDGHRLYFSHDDAGRFFVDTLDADWSGFHTVFALSRDPQGRPRYDLEPARKLLGYEPQDTFPQGSTW